MCITSDCEKLLVLCWGLTGSEWLQQPGPLPPGPALETLCLPLRLLQCPLHRHRQDGDLRPGPAIYWPAGRAGRLAGGSQGTKALLVTFIYSLHRQGTDGQSAGVSQEDKTRQYFAQLDMDTIESLVQLYKYDFEMFGYQNYLI